jgi:hypothetical protein
MTNTGIHLRVFHVKSGKLREVAEKRRKYQAKKEL